MIVTVTLNPAIDKTAEVAELTIGGLNRLTRMSDDPGGKGVNVSKAIAALGGSSVATGFIGGPTGQLIKYSLEDRGITTNFVHLNQSTRTNLKVFSPGHGITEFNEPGPVVAEPDLKELTDQLIEYASPQTIIILTGSLPRGAEPTTYQRLANEVKARGARVILDADGEAFREALVVKPDIVKPNTFELLQYFGLSDELTSDSATAPSGAMGQDSSLRDQADGSGVPGAPGGGLPLYVLEYRAELCRRLVAEGIGLVALSMGSEGALFVDADHTHYCPALTVKVASTVGAGDAMVAGLAHAFSLGQPLEEAARLAMAASAAAVTTQGTRPPDRIMVDLLLERVTPHTLD